jgi:large subunit ribosomal protein L6
MSRIGKMPVAVPAGVTVNLDGSHITVKGPKGELSRELHPAVRVRMEGAEILVERDADDRMRRSLHGLTRALVNNMVAGVTTGFAKSLEINGVGYRCALDGRNLTLQVGYSHPVVFPIPEGITVEVRDQVRMVVAGCDKELVGRTAAKIRSFREPDPYKAKGISYAGEKIRRKAGKAGRA